MTDVFESWPYAATLAFFFAGAPAGRDGLVPFPPVKDVSFGLAQGFYAVCALLPLVFVWKWVEETRGKELEDMHSEVVEPV